MLKATKVSPDMSCLASQETHTARQGRRPLALVSPDGAIADTRRRETVLIVATDSKRRDTLASQVREIGCLAMVATTCAEALAVLRTAPPDLMLLEVADQTDERLDLLDRYRDDPDGAKVPVVCLLEKQDQQLVVEVFRRQADDVIVKTERPELLGARLRARLDRPPLPRARLVEDPVTGALTASAFAGQLRCEIERVARGGRPGAVVLLSLDELPGLEAEHGPRARDELLAQVVRLTRNDGRKTDVIGSCRGLIALLLPGTPRKGAQTRLERLSRLLYEHEFTLAGKPLRLTPLLGYAELVAGVSAEAVEERAWAALVCEAEQLDLHPTRWVAAMSQAPRPEAGLRGLLRRIRTPLQVIVQELLLFGAPLAAYALLAAIGLDISGLAYLVLVAAILMTCLTILAECRAALRRPHLPAMPAGPLPPASAVIAAYLPNEADTVVETVESFLAQDYPDLQVILAYNTPRPLAVEAKLEAIARRDSRFEPLRIEGSVSKAQNVNAALGHVRGEFVGLFDADHHPEPGSFERAWCWLASGAGVVQGHCLVRNGATNWLTKLVATEFEAIYAVSHPGRARLHGFGIFGGSNGYWRTSLLRRTRMRGFMLTEDIDSSMRVVASGEAIVSDPGLVSSELAPETLGALWHQRLRWAQGWSQVSRRHLSAMLRAVPGARRRVGLAYLLGWRELYPWVALQTVPLLTFWWLRGTPPTDWFVPVFVATSLFTLSAGPIQGWFAWRLAHPEIRRHRAWFVLFVVSSALFYTELKKVMARTAHLKELAGERTWKVTPRSRMAAEPLGAQLLPTVPSRRSRRGLLELPGADDRLRERAELAADVR
jgi:cellulose synthase/poly-beta-1,6-N-acetylglucosamine synthase-like glycosyltransferase/PleD family two-component response regulator